MDAASLRRQLAAFLGDEQFRKFVAEFRRAGRLRFWQEQVWDRFTATHPEHRVSPATLLTALRVCELHGAELLPDEVPVVEGNIDYDQRYLRVRREEFPNAAVGPMYTEGGPPLGPTVGVWYCPDCRKAEARWREVWGRTKVPSDLDLTRRTTLDEYGAELGTASLTGHRRERWLAFRAEVEAVMTAGAELWEWESVGFRDFAGVCGLAVVRDGCIVRFWSLGKS
jgi:hypothetical protein